VSADFAVPRSVASSPFRRFAARNVQVAIGGESDIQNGWSGKPPTETLVAKFAVMHERAECDDLSAGTRQEGKPQGGEASAHTWRD
jgi:hypothetical protein